MRDSSDRQLHRLLHTPRDGVHRGGRRGCRQGRPREAALVHMAPTLTGAAMSTAASSAMLLACVVEVLVKIGATIVANTVVGFALSLFLFSALMAAFGDSVDYIDI